MIKKILLSGLIALPFLSEGQIQVTSASMPSVGDTVRYSVSSSTLLDFTSTGPNKTWDFSGLNLVSQDIYRFQSLLSTPYSTLAFTGMPVGAIGYKVADSIGAGQVAFKNIYNFYEKKSSGWSAVGTGFTLSALPLPAGGVYSDKDEIYTFPLNYNDRDSSTFQVVTPLGNQFIQLGTFKQKGYRINKVDGWGSISTPYGSNIPCLRIRSVVMETDSLKLSTPAINIGFPANRVEYRWLSNTEKIPILEVTGTEIAGIFTPSQIRYRDRFRNPPPPPFAPRAGFRLEKNSGFVRYDTIRIFGTGTPSQGLSYRWTITPARGYSYISGTDSTSRNPELLFDSTGVYSIRLRCSNFTGSDDTLATNALSIYIDLGTVRNTGTGTLSLYPNPAEGQFRITGVGFPVKSCLIFDLSGRFVSEKIPAPDGLTDISELSPGIYTLVILGSENIYTIQFTKQ